MGKDEEDVEHIKVNGGNGQEIDRNHAGKVIAQESLPVVGRATTGAWDHIIGDGSLRDGNTELEQLAVNSGRTPQRIGAVHLPNQSDDGWRNGFPASFARPAFPAPEESKPGAMPSDDGAGLNQAEPDFPPTPGMGEPGPQGSVHRPQPWLVGISDQHQELVTEGQILEKQISTRFQSSYGQTEQDTQPSDHVTDDSLKRLGSPAFSDQTEFLPTTGRKPDPARSHHGRRLVPH